LTHPLQEQTISGKPLPDINSPISKQFWEGCKRGELQLQFCGHCNSYQFYPRPSCLKCGRRDLIWRRSTGRGKVYSFTIIRQVVDNSPEFQKEIPFTIGLIELEEGVRMYSNIVDVNPEDVKIGQSVEVIFQQLTPAVLLPKFRVLSSPTSR
jgi:uncharacterized OB-fold protein